MSKQTILYQFLYCPCIHESTYATVSIHFSKDGAIKAMNNHKSLEKIKWLRMFDEKIRKEIPFGRHEDWMIAEIEVQD